MKKLFKPFKIIPKIQGQMLVWLVLIPIFGQLGIISTIIKNPKIASVENITSGNFYTFSIALLASSVLTLAIQLMNDYDSDSDSSFNTFKIGSIIVAFLIIVIMVIGFSTLESFSIWGTIVQLFLYFCSIIMSVYFLCVEYIQKDEDDNYKDLADAAINSLFHKTKKTPDSDGRGIDV
ncbi:hypothetical protein [Planococcus plakortidis]|uniref:hypothetical protein n=1 Tax=Planococcus plakortidis TaxID=1038856 RepID=UPI00385B4070